jgi:hypothetical protein
MNAVCGQVMLMLKHMVNKVVIVFSSLILTQIMNLQLSELNYLTQI